MKAAWAKALTVRYGSVTALAGLRWEAEAGSQWWIVGPNGGGKSTLLAALLGLVRPAAGSAGVTGAVAYLPQRETINWRFPARVRDAVALGCRRSRWWSPWRERDEAGLITACLARVGLAEFGDVLLRELSGGQQQRVLLARALAADASLYLFDEPAKGLDRTSEAVAAEIGCELVAAGKTVITVTHDLGRVARSGGWFLGLAGREVARGPAATVLDPEVLKRLYGRSDAP
ncbi:MAG: manganese ABC transporter ATP-binding protein [Dehalococcoidia bacterium]|nr:MAG: manganese ABC transporter ATP-binding protein [Dehalococcoidia bacterium]